MIGEVVGTIAITAVTIAIGLYLDRRAKLLPRPTDLQRPDRHVPPKYAAGDAPATAIRARESQRARLRSSQRCPQCRGAMIHTADDTVRYDQRELVVLHFRCPDCAAKRTLYIDPTT